MKPALRKPAFLFVTVLPLITGEAQAVSVTYDANTSTAGAQDGAGLGWNTTNSNFWNGTANVLWPNTSADEAIFGAASGAAGTVAVGTVTANKITFNAPGSGNYTLSGGTITLAGTTPTIAGAASATINSVIDGTAGLTKSGAGVLTLNGANTYTGLTKVLGTAAYTGTNSGLTLGSAAKINGNLQLGDGSSPGTVAVLKMGAANQFASTSVLDFQAGTAYTSGAILKLMGFSQTVAGLTSNGRGDNVIQNAENETGSGTTILTIDTAGSNYSFGGTIRNSWSSGAQNGFGTIGITKTGLGTQALTGATSYTGLTRVSGGTLEFGTGTNINGAVTIETNGTLKLTGNINGNGSGALLIDGGTFNNASAAINQTLSGFSSIAMNNGTLTAGVANTSVWGAFHFVGGGNTTITATGNNNTISGTGVMGMQGGSVVTLSPTGAGDIINVTGSIGVLSQPTFTTNGAIVKAGLGTVTLSGANLYTGVTTIKAGNLVAGANSPSGAAGAFGNASSAIVLGNGSTLVGDAPSVLINGAFNVGRAITVGSLANAAAYNATIGGSNTTGTSQFTGNITLNNTAANYTATLRAATGGTVDFNTGTWTTNNRAIAIGSSGNTGTVQLSNVLSTSGGVSVNFGTLNLNIANALGTGNTTPVTVNGGTLAIGGNNQTAVGTVVLSSGSITGSGGVLTSNATYDVRNGSASAILGGSVGLTKTTASTVTLSGANTYSGATLISGGTLALSGSGSISTSSGVSLGTVGTFDVSGRTGGAYTVNNLSGSGTVIGTLTVSSQLAIGNSAGTVNFQSLTVGSSATSVFEVGGGAGDLANVTGTLNLNNSTLNLDSLAAYVANEVYTLFSYTAANNLSGVGTFNGLNEGDTFTNEVGIWKINYAATDDGLTTGTTGDRFVTVTAVPEPNVAALLGGVGVLALLRRRRR